VRSLAFSLGGQLLATGGVDGSATVWSVDSGKELGLALEHPSAVTTVAYDSHGDMWLSGSGKTVHLWRLQRVWRLEDSTFVFDPSIVYTLKFGSLVESVSFAPGGGRILVVTESWLHYFSIDEDGALPITSRLLPGAWMGAFRWCDVPDAIDLASLDTGDRFRVSHLWFDPPEVPPVEGDLEDLLAGWEARLGQYVDENARIAPGF
jgi:WD40 repeat protein